MGAFGTSVGGVPRLVGACCEQPLYELCRSETIPLLAAAGSRTQVLVQCVPPPAPASPLKPAVVVLQPDEMVDVAFQEEAPPKPALRDAAASPGDHGTAGGQAPGVDSTVAIAHHVSAVARVHYVDGGNVSVLRPGTGGAALHVAVVDLTTAGSLHQPK